MPLAVFLHLFPSFVFAAHLTFFAFAMFSPFYIAIFLFKISLMNTFDFVNKTHCLIRNLSERGNVASFKNLS